MFRRDILDTIIPNIHAALMEATGVPCSKIDDSIRRMTQEGVFTDEDQDKIEAAQDQCNIECQEAAEDLQPELGLIPQAPESEEEDPDLFH